MPLQTLTLILGFLVAWEGEVCGPPSQAGSRVGGTPLPSPARRVWATSGDQEPPSQGTPPCLPPPREQPSPLHPASTAPALGASDPRAALSLLDRQVGVPGHLENGGQGDLD